jgi:hypothetical protein
MRLAARRTVPAALVAAMALVCAPALAEPSADAVQRRAEELVRWIAAQSDYSGTLKQSPRFVFLPAAQIRHLFSRTSMGYAAETSTVQAAQYGGAIVLPDTFELGRHDHILVHELVHHLQDESGRRFDCLAEREREAYKIQIAFVRETGIGETPNDMFMLMLRCDIR